MHPKITNDLALKGKIRESILPNLTNTTYAIQAITNHKYSKQSEICQTYVSIQWTFLQYFTIHFYSIFQYLLIFTIYFYSILQYNFYNILQYNFYRILQYIFTVFFQYIFTVFFNTVNFANHIFYISDFTLDF